MRILVGVTYIIYKPIGYIDTNALYIILYLYICYNIMCL